MSMYKPIYERLIFSETCSDVSIHVFKMPIHIIPLNHQLLV